MVMCALQGSSTKVFMLGHVWPSEKSMWNYMDITKWSM